MAATLSEVSSVVRGVLCGSDAEIAETTRFDDLTGWDPMDLIAVVVEIECRFNLQFDLTEIDRLTTIGDLVHMIRAKQALAAA